MDKISEDLLSDILSRLPAQSLMRFKRVNKKWYSLISSPSFTKSHLNRVNASSCQKIIKIYPTQSIDYEAFDRADLNDGDGQEGAIRLLSFPMYDHDPCQAAIVGSCNGLICLKLDTEFILCDPCTGKSRRLQSSGMVPDELDNFWGLGYDFISDDYMILNGARYGVRCSDFSEITVCIAEVFSFKSNSWRQISHEHAEEARFEGVYLSGALHWYKGDRENNSILSFDLADEKFKNVIPTPKVDFEDLGVHEGQLFVYNVTHQLLFKAWILKEDGNGDSSWIKCVDVSTDGLLKCEFYTKLIACTKSGKLVCQADEKLLILFNPEDQKYKNIPVELNDGDDQPVTTYIESLISPFD